jgi:hypothetical protein
LCEELVLLDEDLSFVSKFVKPPEEDIYKSNKGIVLTHSSFLDLTFEEVETPRLGVHILEIKNFQKILLWKMMILITKEMSHRIYCLGRIIASLQDIRFIISTRVQSVLKKLKKEGRMKTIHSFQ